MATRQDLTPAPDKPPNKLQAVWNGTKATVGFVALISAVAWCSVFNRDKLKDLVP